MVGGHENEQSLSYYGCLHNLAKNLREMIERPKKINTNQTIPCQETYEDMAFDFCFFSTLD